MIFYIINIINSIYNYSNYVNNDFLSYILFDGRYAKELIEEGMKDAHANREELLQFFSTIPLKKAA